MTIVIRTNPVTAQINEATPTYAKGTNPAGIALRKSTGARCFSLVHFSSPVPKTVTLQEAILMLRVQGTWTGTSTIRVYEISQTWASSKVTWATKPSNFVPYVEVTLPTNPTLDATVINIPVTAMVQHSQTAKAWYGFYITLESPTGTTARYLYGNGVGGPQLKLTYVEKIDTPTELSPGVSQGETAIAVATPQPDLSALFDPNVSGVDVSGIQVQMTSTESSGVPVWSSPWDSGMLATSDPYLRISDIVGAPSPAADGFEWWRVKFQAENGAESGLSAPVKFYYKPYGTLTMTAPSGSTVVTSTPVVSWTFTGTGRIQEFYQVFVVDPNSSDGTPLWDSGRIQSNPTTSVQIPENVLTETSKTYRIILRVWDTIKRQAANDDTGSIPTYAQQTKDITYILDSGVDPVTSLVGTHLSPMPVESLTWVSTIEPDFFEVVRDNKIIATDIDPDDVFVSGTSYAYIDKTAAPLSNHVWEVRRIESDSTSDNNPTVTDNYYTSLAWLSDFNTNTHIAIAGESPAEIGLVEQGTTFEPINSSVPVHITQSLGGYRGKVSGVLCGECVGDGTTSEELQDRLLDFRNSPGAVYYFYLANIAVPVVIYNVNTYPLYGPRFGHTFGAEFEWHEVKV